MGMFDKDKEIGMKLTTEFNYGDDFILWDVAQGRVDVNGKPVVKTTLTVSRLTKPNDRFEVGTLSGPIGEKAKDATPDEFPAIVRLAQAESSTHPGNMANVLNFVKAYEGEVAD